MRHLEILSNTSVQSENNYTINTKKKKHALVLQLGSSIKYLHKGDNFLNLTLQNEFGITLPSLSFSSLGTLHAFFKNKI